MNVTWLEWTLGSHTGFEKSLYNTFVSSINRGMYATQFFLGSPQAFQRHSPSEEDILASQHLLRKFPLKVFSHYPYVANLAGSKDKLAWNGDECQDEKTTSVLRELQHELTVMSHFPSNGVVIHPGNYTDRKVGLATIAKSINKLEFEVNSCLLLENSAGQGTSLATTFEELKTIVEGVEPSKSHNIGVCLDTCHLHAYGEYDLTQKGEIDRMWQEFEANIGLKRLKLLHLNDSLYERGCRKDRHERIGQGCIWKKGKESLVYLLNKCEENGTPMILETVVEDIEVVANNLKCM